MGTGFKKVLDALQRLDELQASHLDSFETVILPDLEKQMAQRKAGFSDLKKDITSFFLETETLDMAGNEPMIEEIKVYFMSLMHQNEMLKLKIETHKSQIENSMKKLTRGRKVIRAYGSPESQRNRPRAINFKN